MPRSFVLPSPKNLNGGWGRLSRSVVLLALGACSLTACEGEEKVGGSAAPAATADPATLPQDPATAATGEAAPLEPKVETPEPEPEPPPITKASLREHPVGHAWLIDAQQDPQRSELPRAEALGYTLVSIGDDWVPYIFTQQTPGLEDEQPNNYASLFLALAADQKDADGDALKPGEHNYLELYGIPPTLSVVWDEWSRVETEIQPCLDAAGYDPQVFVDLPFERISYLRNGGGKRLARARSAKSQLNKAMRKAKITAEDYASAKDNAATKRAFANWERLDKEVAVIKHAQARLRCEGMLSEAQVAKQRAGDYDSATTHALAAFEKKHNVRGWGHFNADNLAVFAQSAEQSVHARFVRLLTERVANGAGILEDGSALQWKPEFRFTDAQGSENRLRDVLGDSVAAALRSLGAETPAAAHAKIAQLRELNGGNFDQLLIGVKLPDRPAYYTQDMDFSVEINRGDVWYDFPYDDEGKRRAQPRARYPHLTLFVNFEGQKIPLVHWRTTIGSWRSEMHEGEEWFAYKNSDVGPRVWKDIMAAPAWIPPKSTPVHSLTKRKFIDGRYQRVVNYDETGPGYQSAYGLVAAYHIKQVTRRDGTVVELDNQIRTHGSVDYMSIMRRYSHGCHRLYNMNAVRMFSFILQHRAYERQGQHEIGYRRAFEDDGKPYRMRIDTRGYRYRLSQPIPVEVETGRVRGKVSAPITKMMPKPGVEYAAPAGEPEPLEGAGSSDKPLEGETLPSSAVPAPPRG